jgi:hypothetical protein
MPKYQSIVAANEERRAVVKHKSREITKAKEQPFSFY